MLPLPVADTIIAVSSPPGAGGIGIVRLSGPDALPIARTFFRPERKTTRFQSHKAVLGRLFDPEGGDPFDQAILTYFQKPRSYTREDVVEISGHGSPAVLEEAVRLGVAAGARPAGPGEFTLRAYLNGRYDLVQAEAVNDLIRAQTVATAKMAFAQVDGALSTRIQELRDRVIGLLADIEAALEFPDEGIGVSKASLSSAIGEVRRDIETLVSSYETGRSLIEGPTVAVVGRANVGKSTLFNALLGEERAIVAPDAGTTRDYLRERLRIREGMFTIVDMAGLGNASTSIEKEGIRRGRSIAKAADGLLLVLDASKPAARGDLALLSEFKDKKAVLVFNKMDKPGIMDISGVRREFLSFASIEVSAIKGTNIGKLRELIFEKFAPEPADTHLVLFHERQKRLLESAALRLRAAHTSLESGYSEEVCAEDLRESLPFFARLTGEIRAEEIISEIFERFCVGK
jgi:tRNA modification GTPase